MAAHAGIQPLVEIQPGAEPENLKLSFVALRWTRAA